MLTAIATIMSLLIAVAAVCLTLWQNVLQRRAAQAEVFLHMLEQSLSYDVANGMNLLIALKDYDTFEAYESSEPPPNQEAIYKVVDFLNNTASLVEEGLIPRQAVWDLYFWSYRVAHEKLMPWWLAGIRKRSYFQRLPNFERMGDQVARVSLEQIRQHDERQARRYK
jgi:hypothetical protein